MDHDRCAQLSVCAQYVSKCSSVVKLVQVRARSRAVCKAVALVHERSCFRTDYYEHVGWAAPSVPGARLSAVLAALVSSRL